MPPDLIARQKFIGGTDAACILGISPWKTAFDVWQDKMGQAEPTPDNEYMYWGRMLEPVLREAYREKTGYAVATPDTIFHPEYKFIGGNLDGMAADRVVEFKTAAFSKDWGEPGTDEIPPYYIAQCAHYMLVTGLPQADLAVLIGGNDFRIYHMEADARLQKMLLNAERDFWESHVKTGIAPEAKTLSDLTKLYPKSVQKGVTASADVLVAAQSLKNIKQRIKELEEQKAAEETIIKGFMAANDTLLDDGSNIVATWRTNKDSRCFDKDAFKAVYPDLYDNYIKPKPGIRPLLVK